MRRYPKLCYTPEGRDLKKRLWEETMEELNFVGASKIMADLKKS